MSGGHFDFNYYHFDYIAEDIDEYINGHELDEDDVERYIRDHDLDDSDKEYVRINKHTIPNRYDYKDEVVEKMKEGINIIRKAFVYAQRIDYLLSGDDGEASFLQRLQKDLDKLNETK